MVTGVVRDYSKNHPSGRAFAMIDEWPLPLDRRDIRARDNSLWSSNYRLGRTNGLLHTILEADSLIASSWHLEMILEFDISRINLWL